jgi:hypothetical protein
MLNIEKPQPDEGYVILPLKSLYQDQIKEIKDTSMNNVITKKEMISMYTSTVIEINKGDNSGKSLNVKLYNCLAGFAQKEMDTITNRILKGQE